MVAQAPGFVNLLEGHPIETAAVQAKVPLGFWGLNDFYEPDQLRSLQDPVSYTHLTLPTNREV